MVPADRPGFPLSGRAAGPQEREDPSPLPGDLGIPGDRGSSAAGARSDVLGTSDPASLRVSGSSHASNVKTFDELFAELVDKWRRRADGSGTVAALDQGVHHLGKKLVEEAAESWMAAEHEGRERAAEEISQLLYWTQLLMISLGLSLDDVYSHL